jgi:hypothetical protein
MDRPRRPIPRLSFGPKKDVVGERKAMFEQWVKEALEG